jgi:hypothetical protein
LVTATTRPKQDVGAFAGFQKLVLRAAGDHLLAELDEALDDVAQRERLGAAHRGSPACWREED